MELQGQHIIGNSTSTAGNQTFRAFDPAAGQQLDPVFHEATTDEINRACELAARAFEPYRQRTGEERAAFLDRIAEEILAQGDELIERARAETGLGADRLNGERGRTVNQLRLFAAEIREGSWVEATIDRAAPDRKPLPKPDLRRMLIPLGPVAVFGASNFPFAYSVAGGDTASALAAGCPVVVKAHPAHPGTSEMVARAIIKAAQETGMPEGVFSMVHGAGTEVGQALARHPAIKAVGFTGSLRGGRALFDAAAARPEPIPVYAEMGSVNPVFVLPGALRERGESFAEGLKQSVTLGAGQFCTCPGLVFGLKESGMPELVTKLNDLFAGAQPTTMLHPGILQNYEAGVGQFSQVAGVAARRADAEPDAAKTQSKATVFSTDAATFISNPRLSEEVFGPSTLVVSCGTREQLEEIARQMQGSLTATVHATAEDLREFKTLISILETKAGRLIINGYPTGVEVCPAMTHGGPYPATTDSRTTSVGTYAIKRFVRPVSYQNFPQEALPVELRDENAKGIWRLVDNVLTKEGW
ncbi:MAG TPA: aldehyde dehydrogenase (NADP(+)) [Blastocatellia bacterium]|nr:aldehyde dehydrogenase (NADP(+)) [Blastocatellia bacterium]